MNEPIPIMTEALHRGLSDRGHDYETRYKAMYAHARELERQLDNLRNAWKAYATDGPYSVPTSRYRQLLDQFVMLMRLLRIVTEQFDDAALLQQCQAAAEEFFSTVAAVEPETAKELRAIYHHTSCSKRYFSAHE